MSISANFNDYFTSIKTSSNKIGELKDKEAKVVNIGEHKSTKSGKTSIALTIDVDGTEISAYLGFSSEKSIEITLNRLTKLAISGLGMEVTKKLYEDAMNSEDNDTDEDRIIDFAQKIGKKFKKTPAVVIVSRSKTEDGFWDTNWRLPENNAFIEAVKAASEQKAEEAKPTGEFFDSLK